MKIVPKFISDRFGGAKLREADDRIKAAADELCKTISMNGRDFRAMLVSDKERIAQVNRAVKTAHFIPFSQVCSHRGAVVSVCKHPEHPAKGTGIAMCSEQACPFMRAEEKEVA